MRQKSNSRVFSGGFIANLTQDVVFSDVYLNCFIQENVSASHSDDESN